MFTLDMLTEEEMEIHKWCQSLRGDRMSKFYPDIYGDDEEDSVSTNGGDKTSTAGDRGGHESSGRCMGEGESTA